MVSSIDTSLSVESYSIIGLIFSSMKSLTSYNFVKTLNLKSSPKTSFCNNYVIFLWFMDFLTSPGFSTHCISLYTNLIILWVYVLTDSSLNFSVSNFILSISGYSNSTLAYSSKLYILLSNSISCDIISYAKLLSEIFFNS